VIDVNATALEDSDFSSFLKKASFVKTIGMVVALDILLFAQMLQMEVSIGSQYSSMMTLKILNGEVTYAKLTASSNSQVSRLQYKQDNLRNIPSQSLCIQLAIFHVVSIFVHFNSDLKEKGWRTSWPIKQVC
jgi:hypothetical protein